MLDSVGVGGVLKKSVRRCSAAERAEIVAEL